MPFGLMMISLSMQQGTIHPTPITSTQIRRKSGIYLVKVSLIKLGRVSTIRSSPMVRPAQANHTLSSAIPVTQVWFQWLQPKFSKELAQRLKQMSVMKFRFRWLKSIWRKFRIFLFPQPSVARLYQSNSQSKESMSREPKSLLCPTTTTFNVWLTLERRIELSVRLRWTLRHPDRTQSLRLISRRLRQWLARMDVSSQWSTSLI